MLNSCTPTKNCIQAWLRGFWVKIANFSSFFCPPIPKRLRYKENNTKYRSLTRKPRSHVRILIYRTWPIIIKLELVNGGGEGTREGTREGDSDGHQIPEWSWKACGGGRVGGAVPLDPSLTVDMPLTALFLYLFTG